MKRPPAATHPSPLAPVSAAGPEGATCSLLRLAVGDEVVAMGIEDVREILQVSRLTPMPRTPDFVRGVMNLRGAVVPVVDLSARLGRSPTLIGRRSCIVVVDYQAAAQGTEPDEGEGDGNCDAESEAEATSATGGTETSVVLGVLVDAVFEVFDRPMAELEPPPALGTRIPPHFLRAITRAGGELIGVLALPRLLGIRELTAGIANHQLN